MNKLSKLLLSSLVAAAWPAIASEKFDLSKLDLTKLPPAAAKKGVTYANDIRPMLEASCFRCHGQQRPKGDLQLDSLEALLKGGKDGKVVITGDSKKSPLVIAAAQIDDETAMPPKRRPGRGGPGRPGGPGGPGGSPGTPPPGGGNPPSPNGSGAPNGAFLMLHRAKDACKVESRLALLISGTHRRRLLQVFSTPTCQPLLEVPTQTYRQHDNRCD